MPGHTLPAGKVMQKNRRLPFSFAPVKATISLIRRNPWLARESE
jgi:hypothetical protein